MLSQLFGRGDPTVKWTAYFGQGLTFDLTAATLNGVPLGGPLASLSFLGPSEDSEAARRGTHCYYSLGLSIECDQDSDSISGIEIVFRDPLEPQFGAFSGTILANGHSLNLNRLDENGFVGEFGEPFWIDRDDDESILFYEFPGREWQVEFDLQSCLKRIIATNDPLLAHQEQRKAYGVAKPWPPQE